MAVLPTYVSQDALTAGTNTLRLNHKEDGGGAAFAHLGTQIGGLGASSARADYAESAAASAEQKRVDGLSDALVRNDFEQTWHEKEKNLEANIDPTGKDYRATVAQAWQDHVDAYTDAWTGRRKAENEVLTSRTGAHVMNRAIDVEIGTRTATQKAAVDKIKSDATTIVAANPAAFEGVLKDARLKADTMDLIGKFAEPFDREVRRSAEIGRAQWQIMNNPQAALDAAQGAVAGFAKTDVPPEQAKVIAAAKTTNMDPSLMLAIGHIETGGKFNTDATSSAGFQGVFQTKGQTSVYGAHDARDTTAAGIATGVFLAARQQEMVDKGVDPTPGRTFMFHNVGEGIAWRLINEKDPNKPMGQVLYEAYGNSPAKGGGLLRDAVGRNNPQFYNPGMTVGEVRQNYETKVHGAMAATSSFISEGGSNDEVARAAFSKMLGIPVEQLGAADLANVVTDAAKALGTMKKSEIKTQLGVDILNGDVRMQPFNKDHKSAVDDFVKNHLPQVADQLVQGDAGAFASVSSFVQQHSYLPQQWNGALRELVMNGNPQNPAKARAYTVLSSMMKDNPTAYEASGFDKDLTERVKLFQRITDRTNNPAQALQFISTEFDQEHKETVQSLKSVVDNPSQTHPGEVQQLKVSDIQDAFKKDNGLWRKPIEPQDSAQEELMLNAYKQTYKEYRYANKSPAAAKELAIADVKGSWGVSNAFVGKTEALRFMQNPPDKFYSQPILGIKPFEDQAREVVGQELARRFPADVKAEVVQKGADRLLGRRVDATTHTSKYDAANVEVQILPARTTNDEVRAGNSAPPYQVAYRDPRSGAWAIADDNWQPNLDRMRDEAAAAQGTQKIAAEKKRRLIDPAVQGLTAGYAAGGQ